MWQLTLLSLSYYLRFIITYLVKIFQLNHHSICSVMMRKYLFNISKELIILSAHLSWTNKQKNDFHFLSVKLQENIELIDGL